MVFLPGCAGFTIEDLLPPRVGLDEATVAAALREALEVGTTRAAGTLSQPGGMGGDPRFRVRLPEEFDMARTALRTVGLGSAVDDFEQTMNRAAETAAGEAVPVFAEAIASMTIADAFGILQGEEDAATRYFERATSAELHRRFQPVIRGAMNEVGAYAKYAELKRTYDAIPFTKPVVADLDTVLADRTLSALFTVLAEEEARIREDPVARTSALMRKVFGSPEASASAAAAPAPSP